MSIRNYTLVVCLLFLSLPLTAQILNIQPSSAGAEDELTLVFDATQGNAELAEAEKIYMHHGVVTSSVNGTDWEYVIGNWGEDDGVGEMTPVEGQPGKWEFTFSPTIRTYFGVPSGKNIFRIACVFRNADGSLKGTINPGNYDWGSVAANRDIYIDLESGNYLSLTSPASEANIFLSSEETLLISATASAAVSSMKIWLDVGRGYEEKAVVNSGTTISYNYTPSQSTSLGIRITANINGESLSIETRREIILVSSSGVAALPAGLKRGINYQADETKASLVLEAPGKAYAYVVGDFNDWQVREEYQMNITPDGELFWLEIDGLKPGQPYVFQYWTEEGVKIGDPYADQVADPWNDSFIEPEVFPNIPAYDKTTYETATVLQTGQLPFQWAASEENWQRPDLDHLTIYELHLRDFLESHHYQDLIDTLPYLKELGIQAIELMPVSEFEGNDSWGYNPSYFFAPDKYYGTKDDLKQFIQAAHQEGLAVILDMVLNHAYGQNAFLKLYFDESQNRPSPDNPWFNVDYVGPFSWGYDFNHESTYTQNLVDSVNTYWLEEYHFDGFRFDFTKGFTNYAPGGSIDFYDPSRIAILKRMADKIWEVDPEAYVILEHWGPAGEEQELANHGMKMWRNRSYDFVPATIGNPAGSFQGLEAQSHVTFFNSHDERRIAEHVLHEGLSRASYNTRNPLIMYERVKLAAAFNFLSPGPKMMWQFDELGYDIPIDFNGRTGRKPLPWGVDGLGYYEDTLRQYIYDTYQGIFYVRNIIGPDKLARAKKQHQLAGAARRLSYDTDGVDLVVIGNFGLGPTSINPAFPQAGSWYDYFSGEEVSISNPNAMIDLQPGEWHIYTSTRLSEGQPEVVATFDNPVTISPFPFTKEDLITITFDATKAWKNGTEGLIGAEKVYMQAGVVKKDASSELLENIVGTFQDDGIGAMSKVGADLWQITIRPSDYFSIGRTEDIYKLGMWFRDANNENEGYGFRDSRIFFAVESDLPFVQISPAHFDQDSEITITFNARKGNRELLGADKVYIHSSAGVVDSEQPWNNAWNHVIGNWGQDDGVGQMTKVGDGLWEISLVPRDYYRLGVDDHPYWIAAVFRSANGNTKATGTPGEIENGLIHTNLDFFIRNQPATSTEQWVQTEARVFPNPTDGYLNLSEFSGELQFQLFNTSGQQVLTSTLTGEKLVDLSHLQAGIYYYKITNGRQFQSGKVATF